MNVPGRELRRGMLVKGCSGNKFDDGPYPVRWLSEWNGDGELNCTDELGLWHPGGSFLFLDPSVYYKVIFR